MLECGKMVVILGWTNGILLCIVSNLCCHWLPLFLLYVYLACVVLAVNAAKSCDPDGDYTRKWVPELAWGDY